MLTVQIDWDYLRHKEVYTFYINRLPYLLLWKCAQMNRAKQWCQIASLLVLNCFDNWDLNVRDKIESLDN